MPTFSESFNPVSAATADAVARRLGIVFPADYKSFLCTTNGGSPTPNCFMVPDRDFALIDLLYGISNEPSHGDLEYEYKMATELEPLPPGFVVIGHDPGGSSLLLATTGSGAGRVFFWDRNGLWVREEGHNTFPVANSFTAFIESLRPLPAEA